MEKSRLSSLTLRADRSRFCVRTRGRPEHSDANAELASDSGNRLTRLRSAGQSWQTPTCRRPHFFHFIVDHLRCRMRRRGVSIGVKKMMKKISRAACGIAKQRSPSERIAGYERRPPAAEQILWAETPFSVDVGLCVGLKLKDGTLLVGLRARATPTKLEWVPATRVLSNVQADSWSKTWFRAS